MGYIKKEFRKKLEIIDSRVNEFPENWKNFVQEIRKNHNLIIKRKGKSICTNCKHEFITNKKVNKYQKCPNCKNTYLIKSAHLKKFWFRDNLILLDKVEKDIVFRYFQMWSAYDNRSMNYEFIDSVVEFARIFHKRDIEVVNDRVSRCQCHIYVSHLINPGKWREYTRNYSFGKSGYLYTGNLKEIFKDTDYKYLDLRDFAKRVGTMDYERLLRCKSHYPSFEMLIKLKLYKLALYADRFGNYGNFNKIFGVSKEFYPFMKRYDITYSQLQMLRLLKQKDMHKVRYLDNFDEYSFDTLKKISDYIGIDNFIKYQKMHKGKVNIHIYKDYLEFASQMGFDLKNKRYKFPDDLNKRHNELEKSVEIRNRELLNEAIAKRLELLNKNSYKDKKFIIFAAKSIEDLEDESMQQGNCVRTYAKDYAFGKSDIYFMRLINAKDKSLVTVEVKDNVVIQSKTKYNREPEKKQLKFLEKWQKNILQKCYI